MKDKYIDVSKENEIVDVPDRNEFVDREKYLIKCPVCGEPVILFDICDNCEWENSGEYNIDGGAMEMTLEEGIIAYRKGEPLY